jgi:hypothetical protein
VKARNPRRVGKLGRVKPTFSLSNTLKSAFGQDSELLKGKFMRGRIHLGFNHEKGENLGGDENPGEHRVSTSPE